MDLPGNARLLLAAGMPRSASTWMYNAARLLLADSPKTAESFAAGWIDDLPRLPAARHVLLKVHMYDDRLAERADRILYSYRDVRDALASAYRKFGSVPTLLRADEILKEHEQWTGVADYVMRYETMLVDKNDVVRSIADALGVACDDPDSVVAKIEEMDYSSPGPKNDRYHEVNLFHRGHVTRGGRNTWEEDVDSRVIASIEAKYRDWFEEHGYTIATG